MTGAQLATDIRRRTSTSSASLSDASMLVLVNMAKDEIATMVTQKDETYFVIPSTFNLVASDQNAREYSLPDDMLNNLVSVECGFDSTQSPLTYVKVREVSYQNALNTTGGLTEVNVTNAYDNTVPYYFKRRRSIYILSGTISAVTNGLRINYRRFPADLANMTGSSDLATDPTTTSFGVPKIFHRLWAMKVAIDFKTNREKPIALSAEEQNWDKDMQARLSELKKADLGSEILSQIPATTREGNYGINL